MKNIDLIDDAAVGKFREERCLKFFDVIKSLAEREDFEVVRWQTYKMGDSCGVSYDILTELRNKNGESVKYFIGIYGGCFYDEEVRVNDRTADAQSLSEFIKKYAEQ